MEINNGKYIILADTNSFADIPRQLTKINGEPIIKRTIRLLKENGVQNIIITSHDKRFDNLGAERYEPKNNYYIPEYSDYRKNKGYWLNAFPIELLNEPVTFLFGDVYYSKNAIKTIVETPTNSLLFFCTHDNQSPLYIKQHDEPLAYKVFKPNVFKAHIEKVKRLKDEGLCCREPIVWELYRSINGQDINVHKLTKNYVIINDESCDIDTPNDIIRLRIRLGGEDMIKLEALENFSLKRFDEVKNIKRSGKDTKNFINKNDVFECKKDLADYLLGKNPLNRAVVKVIEVEPEIKIDEENENKKIAIFDTTVECESIQPLNTKEELEKLGEEIKKYVVTKPKKIKKAKLSKK